MGRASRQEGEHSGQVQFRGRGQETVQVHLRAQLVQCRPQNWHSLHPRRRDRLSSVVGVCQRTRHETEAGGKCRK